MEFAAGRASSDGTSAGSEIRAYFFSGSGSAAASGAAD